jgi:hypothetical protein
MVDYRFVQPVASAMCFAGSMLFAFSGGGHGADYWKFMFTGQVIGTAGGMLVFISMNTSIIQSFPLEFAGVGGAFAQVLFQGMFSLMVSTFCPVLGLSEVLSLLIFQLAE